jgi:hypothetical protein
MGSGKHFEVFCCSPCSSVPLRTVKFSTAFNNFLLKFNPIIESLAIPFWAKPFNVRVNKNASGFCFFGTYQKPCAHLQNMAILICSTTTKGKQERKMIFVHPHIKFCSVARRATTNFLCCFFRFFVPR